MIRLRLLGSLDLRGSDGESLRSVLAQPKRVALFAYLAVATPNGFHRRDKLLGLFWPESDQEHGRAALRKALHFLRQSLGEEVIVSRGDEEIGLADSTVWCDAVAFERALEKGEPEGALELCRGDLLEGFFIAEAPEFERWLDSERERLRARAAEAAWTLSEDREATGNAVEAAKWARKAVAFTSDDEAEFRRLLEVLDRIGNRPGAVQEYEAFARRLKEEYDLEPSPETQALIASIRERDVAVSGAVTEGARSSEVATAASPQPVRPKGEGATEPKRRWRLVAAATAVALVGVLTWYVGWGRSSGPVADSKSVAVLPFVNVGDDPEREYISDAITGEIINHLGQVADLKVISRTSTMRYKDTDKNLRQIGEELGVATIVEGEVLEIQDRLRINVQLVDAKADIHVWADQYECQVADIFEIHGDIAKRIVTALQATLTPLARERIERKPTEDLEAYDLYLLGRYRWVARSAENLRDAIRFFEAAIERDSTFALAWTGLADAWTVLPWYKRVDSHEAYARARAAAQRALDLDEGLAEAHAALGGLALYYGWEWDRAESHLLRALELNPNHAQAHHWLGIAYYGMGQSDRAIQSVQTAISVNPLGSNFPGTLAAFLYDVGRVEEALAIWREAEKFDPPIPSDLQTMALAFLQQGLAEDGFRAIQRWGEVIGYSHPERLPLVLRAFEQPELTEEAMAVLEDLRRSTGLQAGFLAPLYVNLDAPAEALRIVQEAIEEGHLWVPWLGMTALTRAKVLKNPEIRAALQEAGVPNL